MSKIPAQVREEVSRSILQHAVELGWEDLSNTQKSAQYERWANSPEIGGRLSDYIPVERVRVWIKDGPMKEFKRAQRGLGPYADLAPANKRQEEEICKRVLGASWHILEDSVEVKPNRFDAENDEMRLTVFWGTQTDLKHLVWAFLNHTHPENSRLVIVSTQSEPTTTMSRARNARIAERLNTRIDYISLGG